MWLTHQSWALGTIIKNIFAANLHGIQHIHPPTPQLSVEDFTRFGAFSTSNCFQNLQSRMEGAASAVSMATNDKSFRDSLLAHIRGKAQPVSFEATGERRGFFCVFFWCVVFAQCLYVVWFIGIYWFVLKKKAGFVFVRGVRGDVQKKKRLFVWVVMSLLGLRSLLGFVFLILKWNICF